MKANVMDEGYDLAAFGQFMEYKMGKLTICIYSFGL